MTLAVLLTAVALTLIPSATAALNLDPLAPEATPESATNSFRGLQQLAETPSSPETFHLIGPDGMQISDWDVPQSFTEAPVEDLELQSYTWRPIFGVEADRDRLGICNENAGPMLCEGGDAIPDFVAVISHCPGYGTISVDPTLVCLETTQAPTAWECPEAPDFIVPEGSDIACVPLSLVDPELAAVPELARFNAQAAIIPPIGTSIRTITGTLRIHPASGFATEPCHYCYAEISDAGYLNLVAPTGVNAVDDLVYDLTSMFDKVSVITNYNGQFSFTVNVGLQGALDGSDPIIEVFARDPSGSSTMFDVATGLYSVDSVDPVRTNCGGSTCNLGTIYITTIGTESSSLASEALYLRNHVAEGWAWENSVIPLAGLGDIKIIYPIAGHGDNGYYNKNTNRLGFGTGFYNGDGAYHEFGHWLHDNLQSGFPANTPCTGLHFWNVRSNEVCAFVEGFAHWIGSRVDNSNYLDIYIEAHPPGSGTATFITVSVHQGFYSCSASPSSWCTYIPNIGSTYAMNTMQAGGKCVEGRMAGLFWYWIEYLNHQDTDLLYILHGNSYSNMNTFTELDTYVNAAYSGTLRSHFNYAESQAFSNSNC